MARQTGLKHPHGISFNHGDVMFPCKQLLSHRGVLCEGAEPLMLGLFLRVFF